MGHVDLFLQGVLSSLLLASTPSASVRTVDVLYDQEWQAVGHEREGAEQTRSITSRDRLFAQPTDDAGAKLWPRYDVHFAGTGDDIFISPHHDSWRSRPPTGAIHAPVKVISTQLPPQADAVQWIQQATGLSEVRLAELLGVGRLTVRHWKAGNPIKQEASLRRLLETKDVLRRAQRWHPRPEELVTWLHTPDPDAGISPARLLAHGEFDRARLLAVLEPSAVEPTPAWAKRPVPAAWQEALVLRHA